jgi:glutathione peroxidase-family protein
MTRKTIVEFREVRKTEDNPMYEDLSDQVRTKEEEIQILWNVIKEINKQKGGTLNIA